MKEMNTDKLIELKQREDELRTKWRKAVSELNELVDPIQEHLRECRHWWNENAASKEEIIVVGQEKSFRIGKPDIKPVSYESHLPYGIDYKEIEVEKAYLI